MEHKSGFVNIVGKPNVGKSTLVNTLLGEKLSIITAKPQTTRHRILAILNEDDCQIVFSDTPGYIDDPAYKMQEVMNTFVRSATEDADIFILLVDPFTDPNRAKNFLQLLKQVECPKYLVINKIDLTDQQTLNDIESVWKREYKFDAIFAISALQKTNTGALLQKIVADLPAGPPYFPKDQISDRSERFFVSEIIREKILEEFRQEIPYSCEIEIEEFVESEKENLPFAHILAHIYVERKSQKYILIGKGGASIKEIGIRAREDIERFLGHKVYLELVVKVKKKWRDNARILKRFGYHS